MSLFSGLKAMNKKKKKIAISLKVLHTTANENSMQALIKIHVYILLCFTNMKEYLHVITFLLFVRNV